MNADQRIEQLLLTTRSGSVIARTLRKEGFSVDDTESALLANAFSVQREKQPWGIILHVSTRPVHEAVEVACALMGASSEIAWHTN